jgi:3-oxoacyl-[acyl-carrier protein] reductase
MKILITGASKGIGLAEAEMLANKGHELFLVGSSLQSFKNKRLEKQHLFGVDLGKVEEIKDLVNQIKKETQYLDVLVNNVGIFTKKRFEDMEEAEIITTLDINLKSQVLMTKYILPLLTQSKNPQIVFMSSMAAKHFVNGESVYSSTKGAITNFANVLRNELSGKVKVSTIHSWGVNTFGLPEPNDLLKPEKIAETLDFIINRDREFLVESVDLSGINQWRGGEAPWSPK